MGVATIVLHGLLATAVAPLVVLAWRPCLPVPPALAWVVFVAAHWLVLVGSATAHALVLAAALVFWIGVLRLDGPARSLALFLAVPATDLAAVALFAQGRGDEAVAMIASMLPLGLAALAATWAWMRAEEAHAAL
jgi:hypothetical protein